MFSVQPIQFPGGSWSSGRTFSEHNRLARDLYRGSAAALSGLDRNAARQSGPRPVFSVLKDPMERLGESPIRRTESQYPIKPGQAATAGCPVGFCPSVKTGYEPRNDCRQVPAPHLSHAGATPEVQSASADGISPCRKAMEREPGPIRCTFLKTAICGTLPHLISKPHLVHGVLLDGAGSFQGRSPTAYGDLTWDVSSEQTFPGGSR